MIRFMNYFETLTVAGLVVLIWLIQLLHYPSFHFIDPQRFVAFEQFHTQRISMIVIPLMLVELAFIGQRLLAHPSKLDFILVLLTFIIWLSTFLLQVPCHQTLSAGYDLPTINRLITTNWIRTICWSLKLVLLIWETMRRPEVLS
jgi:hypothetical protein